MLDIVKNGGAAQAASVDAPARTTFADGRMTAKEAWNYCRSLCAVLEIEAPTLRTFKWHLRHATAITGELVRNPFQPDGEKVYAVSASAVQNFVDELIERGDELRVIEQSAARPGVVKRTPPAPSEPPAEEKAEPSPSAAPVAKTTPVIRKKKKEEEADEEELDARGALQFIHRKVGRKCELNQTTFGFYLAYDIIPSRFEGRQRFVRTGDLVAYLELIPDAVYANHIVYETERKKDDLSMREAYVYYSDIDPMPITLNSFRSLVAAGVIRPIRTANNPKAPVVGFRRQEIAAFLALRQRIMEQNSDTTATKAFVTRKANEQEKDTPKATTSSSEVARLMEEALERARPALEEAKRKVEEKRRGGSRKTKAKDPEKREPREAPDIPKTRDLTVPPFPELGVEVKPRATAPKRVPIKQAYEHYRTNCSSPFTFSWFREKVYKGGTFDAIEDEGSSPSGIRYLVSLDSVDAYLAEHPEGKPLPEYLTVETAYHRLRDQMPPNLSLLQFKRLVKEGKLKASTRDGVPKLAVKAVQEYFGAGAVSSDTTMVGISSAHDYYCKRVSDPVARNHFARWIAEGIFEGCKKVEQSWTIPIASIDAFVEEHPTGRLRANRNSQVRRGRELGHGRKKTKGTVPREPVEQVTEPEQKDDETRVTVSISDYSGPDELKRAIDMLAQQGFKVDVRP